MFDDLAARLSKMAARPVMVIVALALSANGIYGYFFANDHYLSGASIAISILTLLLLPILQASQNRDSAAIQAKLDELIRSHQDARNELIGIERSSTAEIERRRPNLSE